MTRVLVIDDDPAVRDAMMFLLRTHGYEAVAAADGAQGLAALAGAPVDLAIIDRFMPNMDGVAAIHAIRAIMPDLPIIAVSGAAFDDAMPLGGGIRCLPKPFRPGKLLAAIAEMLDGGAESAD